MFDIANNTEFLTEIGINDAPDDVKAKLIAGIEGLAEKKLVNRIADIVTDEQVEQFSNITDEKQAAEWLRTNVPNFDTDSIDVIVEILNPKHYDLVSSYSVDNVIISNRYISKMVTQIGEKEAIFDFYNDILQYDDLDSQSYSSKEVYIKKVSTFFSELPGECTEEELIRAVWEASVHPARPDLLRF